MEGLLTVRERADKGRRARAKMEGQHREWAPTTKATTRKECKGWEAGESYLFEATLNTKPRGVTMLRFSFFRLHGVLLSIQKNPGRILWENGEIGWLPGRESLGLFAGALSVCKKSESWTSAKRWEARPGRIMISLMGVWKQGGGKEGQAVAVRYVPQNELDSPRHERTLIHYSGVHCFRFV